MPDLELWQYLLIATGAFAVGLGKGGLPGIGNITIVLMVIALPAKMSVGVLLPILVSADLFAVLIYRRHARWDFVAQLAPWTVTGVIAGYLVFSRLNDQTMQILIGLILLFLTAVHFLKKWLGANTGPIHKETRPRRSLIVGATGLFAGFATMVANAAGPIAQLYFISSGLPKYAFIGTSAWFFFLVNVFKVPFMADLGVLHLDSLRMSARFIPFAVGGAFVAPFLVRHINQQIFETLVWVFVVMGGFKLIFP